MTRSVSNPAHVYQPISSPNVTTYANDDLNRVTSVNGLAVTYTADQQIATALGSSYAYDAIGNLATANASTFLFDAADRMHRQDGGGTTTRYLYDGGQLVGEYVNSFTTLARRHIPGLGLDDIVLTWDGTGTTVPSFLLQDERGSIVGQANGAGTITVNAYDDYGQPAPANTGTFGYTGQMNLPIQGLQHYRMRAYDARLGRFLQTDPIGYQGGANLFAYVGGDPMNFVDPWGLCEEANNPTCTEADDIVVIGDREPFSWLDFYILHVTTTRFDVPYRLVMGAPQHEYNPVVQIAAQCNLSDEERRYLAQHFGTPFAPGVAAVEARVTLGGGNPIDQSISDDGFTVTNQTVRGHLLHSSSGRGGTVRRTFDVDSNGALNSYTYGAGENYNLVLAAFNDIGGRGIFLLLDVAAQLYVRDSGICD